MVEDAPALVGRLRQWGVNDLPEID